MTAPAQPTFAESFDPDHGPTGELDEQAARTRDRRRQPYVVCWPDRCVASNRGRGTLFFHSLLADGRQRGYLAYRLARKTRRWRLTHLYIEAATGRGMVVEIPLWEGRAEITAAPFESPNSLDPPPDTLREIPPPEFGNWDPYLAFPTNPAQWLEIPSGFVVAASD